jgi:hypothetical protein
MDNITLQEALIAYEDEQQYFIVEDGHVTGTGKED